MSFATAPVPDKVALLRTGAHVRRKLENEPRSVKIDTDKAEIWCVPDFLTPDECAATMKLIDNAAVPSTVMSHGNTEVWRTSSTGYLDPGHPLVRKIEAKLDVLLGIPHAWGETMQGQRYSPGQEFKYHLDLFWTEAEYWNQEAKRGGQRTITAMCFLNDVEEGGATEFTNLGFEIAPQAGCLLLWNNNKPDGTPNEDTMHAGTPVVKGTKYIITKWYRSRKWG